MAKDTTKPKGITINSGTFRGSLYSQIVGITVTDLDITLEFVYINPRDKTQGEVVSRVTLPRTSGEELAKKILMTVQAHEKSKGGKKDD